FPRAGKTRGHVGTYVPLAGSAGGGGAGGSRGNRQGGVPEWHGGWARMDQAGDLRSIERRRTQANAGSGLGERGAPAGEVGGDLGFGEGGAEAAFLAPGAAGVVGAAP